MLRVPVKKIRKQFKLLLLLVLLTSAVWFTYLHIHQGRSLRLPFSYGKGTALTHFSLVLVLLTLWWSLRCQS